MFYILIVLSQVFFYLLTTYTNIWLTILSFILNFVLWVAEQVNLEAEFDPELAGAGIGTRLPPTDDQAECTPEQELANAPVGSGTQSNYDAEPFRTAIDDLYTNTKEELDDQPAVPVHLERQPGALVRQLSDCERPWLVSEIDRSTE